MNHQQKLRGTDSKYCNCISMSKSGQRKREGCRSVLAKARYHGTTPHFCYTLPLYNSSPPRYRLETRPSFSREGLVRSHCARYTRASVLHGVYTENIATPIRVMRKCYARAICSGLHNFPRTFIACYCHSKTKICMYILGGGGGGGGGACPLIASPLYNKFPRTLVSRGKKG